MEILSAFLDFSSVLDSLNFFNKKWEVLVDSNEYIGTRCLALISVLFLLIIYLGLLALFVLLIYSWSSNKEI